MQNLRQGVCTSRDVPVYTSAVAGFIPIYGGMARLSWLECYAELSMRLHVSRVAQLCFYHLRQIRAVRSQLGRNVTARLVTVLVLSHLDYCNAVLAGLPASTLAPFRRVLHAAARTVMDLKPRDRVTPALREFHWLPVAERIQYKLCLLVHKSLLGHTPKYISDPLTSVANIPGRSTLRTSSCGNLVVPRTRRRIGDRAFSFAAPRAWNRLPTELKLLRSTDSFRRDLKTFLFHSVYGHQIRVDSVMRPRSSSRGRNTSASVTVTVT